ATLYLWPAALSTGAFASAELGAGQWGSLLALGCAGSGIGVIGYMWLIGEVGPIRAAVVTYLIPPIGVFLGWLVLGEPIGWNLLGGLACVVAGVGLVQGLPVRGRVRRPPSVVPAGAAAPLD
ncbi:MAG: DMT family transporter, partial [Anaerolineaceae bacterium]